MGSLTLDIIDQAMVACVASRIQPIDGNYMLHITPWARAMIVMWEAKARWKQQYRAERIARRVR